MILTLRPEYDPGRVHATQHKITVDPKSIALNAHDNARDRAHGTRHRQDAANAPRMSLWVPKTSNCGPKSDPHATIPKCLPTSRRQCGGAAAVVAVAAAEAAAAVEELAVVPYTACGAPEGKGCEEAMLASSPPTRCRASGSAASARPIARAAPWS